MPALPVYLDHHATTPVAPEVVQAMQPYWEELFGNASSQHSAGEKAARAIERAQEQIGSFLGADPQELIFTSGATEANNLALKGILNPLLRQHHSGQPKPHVISSLVEHRAILDPLKRLTRQGVEVTWLPVDQHGCVSLEQVEAALRPETKLVSLIWANNEIGSLNPIPEIAALCQERGILLHSDAVQLAGKLPIDLSAVPLDLLSLSAHKLYGPKGIGILYLSRKRNRIQLEPQVEGGGHQRGLRSGTLPTPLIVGMGAACQLAEETLEKQTQHLRTLRDQLQTGLLSGIPDLVINGPLENRLPDNLNISIPGVDGEALLSSLTEIDVSSGSACTSTNSEPSHVLRALGRSDELRKASLRFGVGRGNTSEEIDQAIHHVTEVVQRLRAARV